MSFQLPFGVRVLNPVPVENKYFNTAGQPYTATTQVFSQVAAGIRHIGLTVNVNNEEYWFKTGTTNGALVLKVSDVAESGGITGATNGLTKTGANVKLGGTLTGTTTIGLGTNNLTLSGTTGTLKYATDQSANFTSRSLVDKGYVTGLTSNSAVVFSNESGVVKTIETNIDVLGQGQVILTNGSSVVSGISTNFTDATTGLGVSYWLQLWVVDSASNLYRISLASVTNNTLATMSTHYNISDLRKGYSSSRGATFVGVSGTYTYYIVRNIGEDLYSFVGGNGSLARNFSFAFGGGVSATGQTSVAFGRFNESAGSRSFTIGEQVKALGSQSFAGGLGVLTGGDKRVLASGNRSFAFTENNSSQTAGHGARAQSSAILGGLNHDIPSNATRSAIIGGNTIKAVSGITDTVYMPKVRIGQGTGGALTSGSTSNDVIVRGAGGILETRTISSLVSGTTVQTANNGLTKNGTNVRLGGTLTGETTINGNSNGINLLGLNGMNIVDSIGGSINLTSSGGSINISDYSGGITIEDLGGGGIYINDAGNGGIYLDSVGIGGIYLSTDGTNGGIGITSNDADITIEAGDLANTTGSVYIGTLGDNNNGVWIRNRDASGTPRTDLKITRLAATFTDGRTGTTAVGLQYAADYSANFIARSLVDKGYVTTVASSGITTANNGLTKTGQNVRLGGTLTQDTTIGTGGFQLDLSGTTGEVAMTIGGNHVMVDTSGVIVQLNGADTFRYAADYSANFVDRSLVDKSYVDNVAAGLDVKEASHVATTAAISGTYVSTINPAGTGGFTGVSTTVVDGYTIEVGDRILVKNQANPIQNGIYYWVSGTTWFRADDQNGVPTAEVSPGNFTFVTTGATLAGTGWIILGSGNTLTLNTDPINWTQFNSSISYSGGQGIVITGGTVINVDLGTNSGLFFDGGQLEVNPTIAGAGLAFNSGILSANAANGLSVFGDNIVLGGIVTGNTQIIPDVNGSYDFAIGFPDAFNTIGLGSSGNISLASSSGNINLTASSGDLVISAPDVLVTSSNSMKYAADYSANFTPRSLVDKGYVTGLTSSSGVQTANNGLTKNGTNVRLGGTLTGDTFINGNGKQFQISNAYLVGLTAGEGPNPYVGLYLNTGATQQLFIESNDSNFAGAQYDNDYSANFVASSLVNAGWVTGITSAIVQTADNGLSIGTGGEVILGGTLTGNTEISGGGFVLDLGASFSNDLDSLNMSLAGSSDWDIGTDTFIHDTSYESSIYISDTLGIEMEGLASGKLYLNNDGLLLNSPNGKRISLGVVNAGSLLIQAGAGNFKLTDSRTGTTASGVEYDADYSANYTLRSLVDKEYVDIIATSASTLVTANNGLTKTGNNIKLGGALINNTTISGSSDFTVDLSSNVITLKGSGLVFDSGTYAADTQFYGPTTFNESAFYAADYSNSYTDRSLVDKAYVDNLVPFIANTSQTLSNTTKKLVLVSTTGATTITLPASPVDGKCFHIKDKTGSALTNNITIAGNSKNIDGASSATINTDYGSLFIVYSSVEDEWYTLAFVS